MTRSLTPILSLLLALALSSCLPEETRISTPTTAGFSNAEDLTFNEREYGVLSEHLDIERNIDLVSVTVPAHLSVATGTNRIEQTSSDARKALLGRVLFYDTQLSATGETSCASCHKQEAAFSDDVAFSHGINGSVTKRNSIALGSVPSFAPALSGYGSSGDEQAAGVEGDVKFFWDERASTIKEQSEATIQDDLEMGRDINELAAELSRQELYRILTMKAFGTTELTPDRLTLALEKFTATITSLDTRFDRVRDRDFFAVSDEPPFTPSEELGAGLFATNCASCHGNEMGQPRRSVANNGLDQNYTDRGIGALTGRARDFGVFKVPFLRNVALTAPYMHDGRFATLAEVIDHYSDGIQPHLNLGRELRQGDQPLRMNLTAEEKQALVDFLLTTTDETVLVAERFADPFR